MRRGFTAADVAATQHAVTAYGVGLIGLVLVKILAPGFYARQDIRTPVKIGLVVLVATQVMNALFVPTLAHVGLALAIGLGACVNAAMLFAGLRRRGIWRAAPGWLAFAVRLAAGLAVLGAFLAWADGRWDWIALREAPLVRVGVLSGIVAGGALLYLATLFAGGMRVRDFRRRIG